MSKVKKSQPKAEYVQLQIFEDLATIFMFFFSVKLVSALSKKLFLKSKTHGLFSDKNELILIFPMLKSYFRARKQWEVLQRYFTFSSNMSSYFQEHNVARRTQWKLSLR